MIHLSTLVMLFFCSASLAFSQELNVLVIGSTHSFSEAGENGVVHEKAFNPTAITNHLQGILAQDPMITETVNVVFEDIYKTKAQQVDYGSSTIYDFTSHCYSLAQHFVWTDGKDSRLANLRGEGALVWDYIVLCNDPYITANFPGMVAEGVKMIKEEVAKSANPAQIVLLAQWPESSSPFTVSHFNEIAYRVGNSAGLSVVPAGKVWDSYDSKDTSTSHPTPQGEYLAAASIYTKLFGRSAKTSAYDFPSVGDAIADHALSVIQSNASIEQYSGNYSAINPFLMKNVSKREVSFRETGTSTEDRIRTALGRLDDVLRITLTTTGYTGPEGTRWDFNYGRGNDWWEPEKQYEVNPTIYDRSYGFPMHHYKLTSAPNTMPYGIDKHYWWDGVDFSTYEDGTDLGIAYNMVRPGPPITRELSLPEDVRAIPIRLMWLKMLAVSPGFNPLGDDSHMSPYLNDASAAFMYTLLSSRCPVVAEPSPSGSTAWLQWLGHKIGYETAWQMSRLTTRSPGFRVLPSATTATTVTPTTTETMSVQFAYPPQADVTVTVSNSSPTAAIISPKTLIFTPTNYNTPQQVIVKGIPGSTASDSFDVSYAASSNDEIYHDINDSWNYTNNRTPTQSLTQVNRETAQVLVLQNTTRQINLGVAAANSTNTILAGPQRGSIIWQGNGVIQYTPNTGYIGPDHIAFAITNGTTQTIGSLDISVEIPDDQVTVIATDASASEEGPNNGTYVISRVGDTASPLNVFFGLSGTATLSSDYTLSHTSSLTIPAGQSSGTITLTPVDDDVFSEGNETAILTIIEDAAYSLFESSAIINISDNDNIAPVVEVGGNQTVNLGAATPWQPTSLIPKAWYDASDASTITSSGGLVSEWRDKSTNNYHAIQLTAASQPSTSSNTMGGRNVISFNGTSQFFNVNLDYLAGNAHSAFIVTKPTVYGNIYGAATGGTANKSLHVGFSSNTLYRMNYWGNSWTTTIGTAFNISGGNVLNYIWIPSVSKEIFANGTFQGSSSSAGNIGTMQGGGRIGNVVGQGFYGGDIAEMIYITGTVDAADREFMEGYLAHKWGLTETLPLNHPHKSESPITASATMNLDATVTDADAVMSGQSLSSLWTKISGPGSVIFSDATAVDTTAIFNQSGTYILRLTTNDGIDQTFDEITVIVTELQTFNSWIGGFSDLDGLTSFEDDADGDGIKNGVEAFFGTPPNAFSAGLSPISINGSSLSFTHPEAEPPISNLTGSYEWSLDLLTWHHSGDEVSGVTAVIEAAEDPLVSGTTTVTVGVSGTQPNKIFVRTVVTQN